ncbi:MAG: right-handed parallel beta-helix repeat-containing protein, partial [Candidatus Hydrogenedentes bacterium]|nr:right-handed parallel beta-helix repeat-containing protein [Candidatus Hydrogenedentota bacterium]
MHSQRLISDFRFSIFDFRFSISDFNWQSAIGNRQSAIGFVLAVLLSVTAVPAFAADDASDTVVLGVTGNETFELYKSEGYVTANTPAAALAEFTGTSGKTRLLILKNAASNAATVVGEWTWPSMTTPPGSLKKIEGGSLTKPYDVILHGTPLLALFDFTSVGEDASPFVIRGVTLTGGFNAVAADGTSRVELDRCYIREQAADVAGVVVSGSATAKLTNCVFYKNFDGILVDGAAATAEITHCTFYDNRASGVHVKAGGKATLVNTLMYRNAAYGIWDEAGTPQSAVSSSNSNDNASGNYSPGSLQGTGNYSEIVDFDTQPWQGRMLTTSLHNLTEIHKGASVSGVTIDFEGDGRGSEPFNGADELNPNASIGVWTRCEIYEEPVGRRGADVLINYSGTIPNLGSSLCLLPDGVEVNDLAYDIEIPLDGGDGIYWGRIPNIDTILGEANGKTYIADSDNAQLILRLPDRVLDLTDEGSLILGQAVDGHKGIVIDTIPPAVDLQYYTTDALVWWNGAATAFGAAGITFAADQPGYAFPYPVLSGLQMTEPAGSLSHAVYTPAPPEPPVFLYNVGSVANGYNELLPEHWLYLKIQATFMDPDVYTAKQLPADGYTRTPSGFNYVAAETATGELSR